MYSPTVVTNDSKLNIINVVESPEFMVTGHYHRQLNNEKLHQDSLLNITRLASQVNMKHDAKGCKGCDIVASYYINALRLCKEVEPIECTNELLNLVWKITNLVLAHQETSMHRHLSWFDTITLELWKLAKQLKGESYENDLHIPLNDDHAFQKRDSIDSVASDNYSINEEHYRRAIRITIYNCRALVYEQSNIIQQAIVYYRKCASVRPTATFESQQRSALAAMRRLSTSSQSPSSKRKNISFSTMVVYHDYSSSDSISSRATKSSGSLPLEDPLVSCSNCGIEKVTMPICARCKIQPYCSIRCLNSHKVTHNTFCSS
ncbi:MAG: hypothetical protein EXX96DRAFT_560242 [Benjaminiella poitrasii]|nr:MAG: hypothetical protein EXX96DRAFT_560242 [Benjaminiella poitrasii]